MKRLFFSASLIFIASASLCAQNINILYTTDVHGAIFPYSFTEEKSVNNSMSQVYSYIKSVRDTSDNVIVLDNGDFLQGTPVNYYYNYIEPQSVNIVSEVYNFLGLDALGVGNHDIEPGHEVYDKIKSELHMPWIAANAVSQSTRQPYFEPYIVAERAGKRIAIIGLITPYISHWLPESKWLGIDFEDMVESAQKWVDIVREKEHPDAIVGLFHSGYDYNYGGLTANTYCNENASLLVAERVDGFNAILIGHDHKIYNRTVSGPKGTEVVVLDAGTAARNVGLLNLSFDAQGQAHCKAQLIEMKNVAPSAEFDQKFALHLDKVKAYTQKEIATVSTEIRATEALFGSSAIVDIAHKAMLSYTNADISVSAPLQLNTVIPVGSLTVGKMFSIYKFENTLNVLKLTGKELKGYLEYSYNLWLSSDVEKNNHLIQMNEKGRLKNQFFNFDSAAGIVYTVDPFKAMGERISIVSMADGKPFDMQKTYTVAINSYRSNGGGGHLERGAGLSLQEIAQRQVASYDRDLRSIIVDYIANNPDTWSQPLQNWKFVPENKVKIYSDVDKKIFNLQ